MGLSTWEAELLMRVNDLLSGPVFDAAAQAFGWLGDRGRVFVLLAFILMCIPRTRAAGAVLATALVLDVLVVNLTLKPLFARIRPYELNTALRLIVPPLGDFSFPSGHTAAAFATAVALRPLGKAARRAAWIFAAIMGLSRMYLLVHYPTDVVAGALAGALCGWLALTLWKKLGYYDKISS